MTTTEWIVAVGGGLIAPFLLATLIGLMLPRQRVATRSVKLKQRPESVWATIIAIDRLPGWWPLCLMVESQSDHDGRPVYRQTFRNGRRLQHLSLEVVEAIEPTRFVTRIADPKNRFLGRWVQQIETLPEGGCRLTLSEHSETPNPLIRTLSRLMLGNAQFIDSYLFCLGRKFGEPVTPE